MLNLKISENGIKLLKISEGIRYSAYKDGKGNWTTGIGHLIRPNEQYLITKKLSNDEVNAIFQKDIQFVENWINSYCTWKPPIIQQEFDSLCDFLFQYNIDLEDYANTKKIIISGNRDLILKQLLCFVNQKKGSGDNLLLPRRKREISLFKNGSWS